MYYPTLYNIYSHINLIILKIILKTLILNNIYHSVNRESPWLCYRQGLSNIVQDSYNERGLISVTNNTTLSTEYIRVSSEINIWILDRRIKTISDIKINRLHL